MGIKIRIGLSSLLLVLLPVALSLGAVVNGSESLYLVVWGTGFIAFRFLVVSVASAAAAVHVRTASALNARLAHIQPGLSTPVQN
jgi:hypothetical protein